MCYLNMACLLPGNCGFTKHYLNTADLQLPELLLNSCDVGNAQHAR